MRGDNLDHQTAFGDLDLIKPHPFWQLKQGSPFHHDLTFANKTIFERFFWNTLYHYMPTCRSMQARSKPPKWTRATLFVGTAKFIESKDRGSGGKAQSLEGDAAQKRQGQHDQGDMAIPSQEAAHFVVIQSEIFAILKIFFNAPTTSQSGDFGLQRGLGGSKDQIIGQVWGGSDAATDEQRVPAIVSALLPNGQGCPVKETRPFGPFAHGQGLPVARGKPCGDVAHFQSAHAHGRQIQHDWFITGDSHHVGLRVRFQPDAQVRIATIDAISHDPLDPYLSLRETLQHEDGQLRLGAEGNRGGDANSLSARPILGPVMNDNRNSRYRSLKL